MTYEQSLNQAARNQINSAPKLAFSVMPLIALLDSDELSWADREQIASVIRRTIQIHKSHLAEQGKILGGLQAAAAQGIQHRAGDLGR